MWTLKPANEASHTLKSHPYPKSDTLKPKTSHPHSKIDNPKLKPQILILSLTPET